MGILSILVNIFSQSRAWYGVAGMLTALGYQFTDMQADDAVSLLTGLVSFIGGFLPAKK
jgi:hypothetical protein